MRSLPGRFLKRIRPREGWPILLMALTALLCPAAALIQVTEGLGTERILVISVLAALSGLALARSRLSSAWAAVLGTGLGIGLIIVVLGGLLPPAWLLWREVGYAGDWWQSWQQGTPLQPVPFATAARRTQQQ